jgi:hypothetical protein
MFERIVGKTIDSVMEAIDDDYIPSSVMLRNLSDERDETRDTRTEDSKSEEESRVTR